jgi:protein-tyrosine phosphatase
VFCQTNPNSTIVVILPESLPNEVNAAFLCGSYAILGLNVDASEVYYSLTSNTKNCYIPFKDAGFGTFTINLHDCLRSLQRAKAENLLNFASFDVHEYQYYERVENGDLNWIIPGKMLAFKTPEDHVRDVYQKPPETYFDYFREHNVKLVVRLNYKTYDRRKFLENGFDHQDLYFEDGSSPSLEIMHKFLEMCEKTNGAIAVHCKAGLGRTGTLIACYLIKHFNFDSREAIAWTRICRPGSVIGLQQSFLEQHERLLSCMNKKSVTTTNKLRRKSNDDCLRCPESSENLLNVQYDENKWSSVKPTSASNGLDEKNGDQMRKITSEVQQIVIDDYSNEDEKHMTQGDLLNLKKVHRMLKASENAETKRVTRSQTRLEQNQNQPPTQSNSTRVRLSTDKYLKKKIATLVEKIKEAGDLDSSDSKGLANKRYRPFRFNFSFIKI